MTVWAGGTMFEEQRMLGLKSAFTAHIVSIGQKPS